MENGNAVKVRDVVAVLGGFAPEAIQEKWDNSGLCLGNPDDEVSGILLGLDCTPALVEEAKARGFNMIVTHHPLIFNGLKKIVPGDPVSDTVISAVRSGISVYSSHTPADKVIGGVSWLMAERLGLEDVTILAPEPGEVGLGTVGNLPAPVNADEIVELVKSSFGLTTLRCSAPIDGISRVAMCGGSGSSLIQGAMASGAQLYICADISYHHFFTPAGFMIMDIGHYESEIFILQTLISLLRKNFHTFAVHISESPSGNPVHYF